MKRIDVGSTLQMAALKITIVAALFLTASSAWAGGISVARFGGEIGHPTATNPTAIYFNPAGIASESGHRIFGDATLAWVSATYERFPEAITTQPPSDPSIAANTGTANLENFGIIPFIGFVTDFGTGAPFGIGVAFYAPFGGQSVYDKVPAVPGAPGAVDGPQRWWAIDGTMQTLALSTAGAYRIESLRLSFGLAFNVFFSRIDSLQAQNADGSDDLWESDGSLKEGRVRVDASSVDFGLGAGIMWEPLERLLWLGLSYQSRPNMGRDMELEGTIENLLGATNLSKDNLIVRQQMPDTLRFGVRYRPAPNWELRFYGDWTRWSAFEGQCFVNTGVEDDPERACQFNADGSQVNTDTQVAWNVTRRWENTFGLHLGGSYFVVPEVEIMLGIGYDKNAIPDSTFEPGLLDFDLISAAVGLNIWFNEWVGGVLTIANFWALERDTRGETTFSTLEPPSRQPNSAGVYNQNILTFNVGVKMAFGQGSD